jgi:uncharacterized protein
MSAMTDADETGESPGTILCKSCGLCCTGHLFSWAQLRPAELDAAEALGMKVFRSDPRARRFSQPCPLWQGQCTIYTSPQYPHACRSYKCKLLKEVLIEKVSLPHALTVVQGAKEMINELESRLPASTNDNFRERLVEHIEYLKKSGSKQKAKQDFMLKANVLLSFYKDQFGVDDLIDNPEEK